MSRLSRHWQRTSDLRLVAGVVLLSGAIGYLIGIAAG